MLQRTVARLALRRSNALLSGAGPIVSYGRHPLGSAYAGEAGADGKTLKPPETFEETKESIKAVFTPNTRRDLIEAIGYPGQRHFCGGITTLGRINYGIGRYDYGRPLMPKGWFQNIFYPCWEFGHLFFVVDKWIFLRVIRHVVATAFCAAPWLLIGKWSKELNDADP
mmetsp:Transcript_43707/g.100905  ORF Transcript_43707/g.100905 Transcript_43707/m.100905 type:complete len:168 (+) Transcript_43707:85-588(+)